jgi:hypothetical protein
MWKIIALYAPILGAVLISGALTIDEFHNWYDVVAGGIIGSVMAISSYRMVYASVWDFRFNHIPLTRHTPFAYGGGAPGAGGFESAVWTHQAGWGFEEALGGAPFDAAHGLRGAFGGASGLRSGGAGLGNHDHGHSTHGEGIPGAAHHSHGDGEVVGNGQRTHNDGRFDRSGDHHGNSGPVADRTSQPHSVVDGAGYSNDMTEVPSREPGIHNGNHQSHGPGHDQLHQYHHHHQGSIGRRPVPPTKDERSYFGDRMV